MSNKRQIMLDISDWSQDEIQDLITDLTAWLPLAPKQRKALVTVQQGGSKVLKQENERLKTELRKEQATSRGIHDLVQHEYEQLTLLTAALLGFDQQILTAVDSSAVDMQTWYLMIEQARENWYAASEFDPASTFPDRVNQIEVRLTPLQQYLSGDESQWDLLLQIARDSNPIKDDLYELQQEALEKMRLQAADEALQAARESHKTHRTERQQELRDQAIEELRAIRPERPSKSITKLRDHYVSKYEGRVPEGKEEVYEYIKKAKESTLYSWNVF